MIRLEMNLYSRVLRTGITVQVLLPNPLTQSAESPEKMSAATDGQRMPVLYLLHDLSGDETSFLRQTALERYLSSHDIMVVMPGFGRGFGVDQPGGPAYGRFLSWELPSLVEALFPVSPARADRLVAGVDAGGYAAFRLALAHPERYAAAAALSAPVLLQTLFMLPDEEIVSEMTRVFGPQATLGENGFLLDVLLAAQAGRVGDMPRLLQLCGRDDFFLDDNRRFATLAGQYNTDLRYRELPGTHDWGTWDAMLPQVIEWFRPDKPSS